MLSTISPIQLLGIFSTKQRASSGLVDPAISLETNLETAPSIGRDIHVEGFQEKEYLPADKPIIETALSQGTGFLSFGVSSTWETTLKVASEGGCNIPSSDGFHEKGNAYEHEAVTETAASHAISVPSSNGFQGEVLNGVNLELEGKSLSSNGADTQKFLKTIWSRVPVPSPTVYKSMFTLSGLNEKDENDQTEDRNRDFPTSVMSKQCHSQGNNNLMHVSSEAVSARTAVIDNKDNNRKKDYINRMLVKRAFWS